MVKSTTTSVGLAKKKSLNETLVAAKAFDYHSLCDGQAIFLADPFVCNRYLRCNHGYAQKFKCSRSTAWDDAKRLCLWTSLVTCGERVYVSNHALLGDDDATKTTTTTTTTTTETAETTESGEEAVDQTFSTRDTEEISAEPKRATLGSAATTTTTTTYSTDSTTSPTNAETQTTTLTTEVAEEVTSNIESDTTTTTPENNVVADSSLSPSTILQTIASNSHQTLTNFLPSSSFKQDTKRQNKPCENNNSTLSTLKS
jgi:hypothetical protein